MPAVIRGVRLSSSQLKALEAQIDALKGNPDVDNPHAVATKSFTDGHVIRDGRWALKKKSKGK